jgi:hypothetical protein
MGRARQAWVEERLKAEEAARYDRAARAYGR